MNEEEIRALLVNTLRLEIDYSTDYYSPKEKTYSIKLILGEECLSTVYFDAMT